MDKLYFRAPPGNAPKSIRGQLSSLTNTVYCVHSQQCEEQELIQQLKSLLEEQHYRDSDKPFIEQLDADLYQACRFWEEPYRYDDCWPIIKKAITTHL